jgi:hypothetical protein
MNTEKMLLPELQREILRYLPDRELKRLLTLNKDLYAFISLRLSFKTPLKIIREEINDFKIFHSMISTLRKFKEVAVDVQPYSDNEIEKIQDILNYHGESIINLRFFSSDEEDPTFSIKQSTLFSWLNAMPNLETFIGHPGIDRIVIADGIKSTVQLPKLQTVAGAPIVFQLKLHEIQCNLTQIKVQPLPNLSKILNAHHESLRFLTIRADFEFKYDLEAFKQLSLEAFTLIDYKSSTKLQEHFLMDFLKTQKNLKILEFHVGSTFYNQQILRDVIVSLKFLEELHIEYFISSDTFEKILRGCQNLKNFYASLNSSLTSAPNHSMLEKLTVEFSDHSGLEISPCVIEALPNLVILTVLNMKIDIDLFRVLSKSKVLVLYILAIFDHTLDVESFETFLHIFHSKMLEVKIGLNEAMHQEQENNLRIVEIQDRIRDLTRTFNMD